MEETSAHKMRSERVRLGGGNTRERERDARRKVLGGRWRAGSDGADNVTVSRTNFEKPGRIIMGYKWNRSARISTLLTEHDVD